MIDDIIYYILIDSKERKKERTTKQNKTKQLTCFVFFHIYIIRQTETEWKLSHH